MRASPIRIARILAAIALTASSAFAQDRLFINRSEVGAIGRFGEIIGPAPALPFGEFIGGGRYVRRGNVVIDTRTGLAAAEIDGAVVSVDPGRPRVFFHRDGAVWALHVPTGLVARLADASGYAQHGVFIPTPAGPEFSYASANDELFIRRGDAGGEPEIAVIDARTGR